MVLVTNLEKLCPKYLHIQVTDLFNKILSTSDIPSGMEDAQDYPHIQERRQVKSGKLQTNFPVVHPRKSTRNTHIPGSQEIK